MIIWPSSKRSVLLAVAKEISKFSREYGAATCWGVCGW
ncbi:hypothetical protein Patl1_24090 [Pistacia atlantica]|uniref:Uncharacterized protein n=1 Tax=Pistacia atlantica TaxID=434234 RepID=A0ACC0ZYQ7_9ROSI|nr:hypothetical protein Patl1_24090 [Pistacia atlantica]